MKMLFLAFSLMVITHPAFAETSNQAATQIARILGLKSIGQTASFRGTRVADLFSLSQVPCSVTAKIPTSEMHIFKGVVVSIQSDDKRAQFIISSTDLVSKQVKVRDQVEQYSASSIIDGKAYQIELFKNYLGVLSAVSVHGSSTEALSCGSLLPTKN